MPRKSRSQSQSQSQSEEVFLEIGFRSSERSGTLKTIELVGLPGEKNRRGEFVINNQVRLFFDDLIARPLFAQSRRLPDCDFEHLKIWLYDTETPNNRRGYQVPKIESPDFEIPSTLPFSQLESIYVLDNGLTGSESRDWKRTVEELFNPLFRKFIAPPDPPEHSNIFGQRVVDFMGSLMDWTAPLDPHRQLKRNLFFNALIIQID